jgi:hypothetical protein
MRRHSRRAYYAERLEDRRLLAAVSWDAGGDGVNWSDPNNWSNNLVPGGSDDVTINIVGSPTIVINAAAPTINSLVSFDHLSVPTGGSLILTNGATLHANLSISGGTFAPTQGTSTFNGVITQSAGFLTGGSSAVWNVNNAWTITSSSINVTGSTIYNNGTISFTTSVGAVFLQSGAEIINNATGIIELENDSISNSSTEYISNKGLIRRTTAGQLIITLPMNDEVGGEYQISNGQVMFNEGGSGGGADYTITAPGKLEWGGGTFSRWGTISGAGDFQIRDIVSPNTLNIPTGQTLDFNLSGALANISSCTINGPGTVRNLGTLTYMEQNHIAPGATVRNDGTFNFNGGLLNGVLNNYATMNITPANFVHASIPTGTLHNYGTVYHGGNGGYANVYNDGRIENHVGALWEHRAGTLESTVFTSDGDFVNYGTFRKVNAGGVTVNAIFDNQPGGIVEVTTGTLTMTDQVNLSAGTLSGGAWIVRSGTTLTFSAGNITTNNASITLDGSTASFAQANTIATNNGTLTLENSKTLSHTGGFVNNGNLNLRSGSTLSVTSSFSCGSLSLINSDITSNSVFGKVNAGGALSLNGTLSVDLVGAYDPVYPTLYSMITGNSRSGTFTLFDGDVSPSLRTLAIAYTSTLARVGVAPSAPLTPDLVDASDNGISIADNLTNDTTPTFARTSAVDGTITLLADGVPVGSGSAVAGTWNATSGTLTDGTYLITATITDANGLTSNPSPGLTITIDTVAPAAPSTPNLLAPDDLGFSNADDVTSDNTPRFVGTAPVGIMLYLYVDGVPVNSTLNGASVWQLIPPAIADGAHSITAVSMDNAGNLASSAALSVQIDTVSPTVLNTTFTWQTPQKLDVAFSEDVGPSLAVGDLLVREVSTLASTNYSASYSSDTATLTFPSYAHSAMPDQIFEVRSAAAAIEDLAGNPLTGPALLHLNFFLNGDANRDGKVSTQDFNMLAGNFGSTGKVFSEGNFNYDALGKIDSADFNLFTAQYGKKLTLPSSGAAVQGLALFASGPEDSSENDLLI